jgi:hypothetical protein
MKIEFSSLLKGEKCLIWREGGDVEIYIFFLFHQMSRTQKVEDVARLASMCTFHSSLRSSTSVLVFTLQYQLFTFPSILACYGSISAPCSCISTSDHQSFATFLPALRTSKISSPRFHISFSHFHISSQYFNISSRHFYTTAALHAFTSVLRSFRLAIHTSPSALNTSTSALHTSTSALQTSTSALHTSTSALQNFHISSL